MRATRQLEVQNSACCACCRAILHERPSDNDGRRHKSVQHAQTAHEQQDLSSLPTQCLLVQNAGEICEEFLKKGPTAFQNELKAFCTSATITSSAPPPLPVSSSTPCHFCYSVSFPVSALSCIVEEKRPIVLSRYQHKTPCAMLTSP